MRECQRKCKRIGSIRRGGYGELQHALDHSRDRSFLGGAIANDGLFDFARRDFVNRHTRFGNNRQRGAPGFTHDQGRLQILSVEQTFDCAGLRLMLLDHSPEALRDVRQAAAALPTCRAGDRALRDQRRRRFRKADDAVTRTSQGRIDSEHRIKIVACRECGECGSWFPSAAGNTFLHLFELLSGDCHNQSFDVAPGEPALCRAR